MAILSCLEKARIACACSEYSFINTRLPIRDFWDPELHLIRSYPWELSRRLREAAVQSGKWPVGKGKRMRHRELEGGLVYETAFTIQQSTVPEA